MEIIFHSQFRIYFIYLYIPTIERQNPHLSKPINNRFSNERTSGMLICEISLMDLMTIHTEKKQNTTLSEEFQNVTEQS